MVNYLNAAGIRARLRPLERAAFFRGYSEKKLLKRVDSFRLATGQPIRR